MRFNRNELASLALNPQTIFQKEGLLNFTERQETFFRSVDVNCLRWCKLHGNLLFYFNDHRRPIASAAAAEERANIAGVLVLEHCRPVIRNETREYDGYAFILEFEGSTTQRLTARTANERLDWVKAIQLASNAYLTEQARFLRNKLAAAIKRTTSGGGVGGGGMGNASAILAAPYSASGNDALLLNVAPGVNVSTRAPRHTPFNEDITEVPICESSVACDSLPCDASGRPPNARVVCSVLAPGEDCLWHEYACTEYVEHSTRPQFLCTFAFKRSDGFDANTLLRFSVHDVRERVSLTAVPIGYGEVSLAVIQDATRFRMPLRSLRGDCGYLTISSWVPDTNCNGNVNGQPPPRSVTQVFQTTPDKGHRRSQSLPPRLGVRLFVPFHCSLQRIFTRPWLHRYRLQSSLGADISVHELMLEFRPCFSIPQQLLSIWINGEKELLQEIAGVGELTGDWRCRQMDLLDMHLKLLKDYSQAKQNLYLLLKQRSGACFKRSSAKADDALEFLPVNLHLQRMCAQNDTLNRAGVLDIITVGAFTRHTASGRAAGTGGLIKLLQIAKESPSKLETSNICKVQAANDIVQATKQLRKEIVDIMSQLLGLARYRNPKGMMALCDQLVTKTKCLLSLWEPQLVAETFAFVEQHRLIKEPDNTLPKAESPFHKISQQLNALDLQSPELEDFATPLNAPPDLWPRANGRTRALVRSNSWHLPQTPSVQDMTALCSIEDSIRRYNKALHVSQAEAETESEAEQDCQSLPVQLTAEQQPTTNNAGFLDTTIMSMSPAANYYRPTEEPEPLDLTQLNIEASVMCLVSKLKFLCGRCGSPAIRLRQPKAHMKRLGFATTARPDLLTTAQTHNELNLALSEQDQQKPKKMKPAAGNKFTDGLELSLTTDWQSELRPSMRKLRHAMDGLLKTARLMHSVQRLQQDMKRHSMNLEVLYRRDVCFSQALTALLSGLMAKLWGSELNVAQLRVLCELGPLAYFEGLLSLFGNEKAMWGDMCIAIEDLLAVNFRLVRSSNTQSDCPRVLGTRQALEVQVPVPEHVFGLLPSSSSAALTFKLTPVFFNIGVNEKATIAETLGTTREQHRSNWDNFVRLKQYYARYRKLQLNDDEGDDSPLHKVLSMLEQQLRANVAKNVKILHLAEDACRLMYGLRYTSCKSAKDRTGMAVTLEQCRVLVQEFQLPAKQLPVVLNTLRSEGTRMDNVEKNIERRKYAFNLPQVLSLPLMYRPPVGAFGKAPT